MALNKQVVIGRSITEGEEELLSNFLKCYPLTDYKVNISTGGTTGWNIKRRTESPRLIILDNKNNCYYKIFPKNFPKILEIEKYDHVFINNAHFPNHLVTSVIEEDVWFIKQTIPKGILLSKIIIEPNTVNEKIIDSILSNLLWAKKEADRIFLDTPKNKYWMFSQQLDIGINNIIFNAQNNTTTNIDIEPSSWLTRDQYLKYAFKTLVSHLGNWSQIPNCKFLSVLEQPKILDKCMMFIDKEIL